MINYQWSILKVFSENENITEVQFLLKAQNDEATMLDELKTLKV